MGEVRLLGAQAQVSILKAGEELGGVQLAAVVDVVLLECL